MGGRRKLSAVLGAFVLVVVAFVVWLGRLSIDNGIGVVRANDWVVDGLDQEGQRLVVSTFFGGVASDCARFAGWEVDERDDAVEINALIWHRLLPSGCTDDGASEELVIELDDPLGDRPLRGCGESDCLGTLDANGFNTPAGDVVATDNFVVVQRPGASPIVFDNRGESVDQNGESAERVLRRGVAVSGDVVLFESDQQVVALDIGTDEILWSAEGFLNVVDGDSAFLCRGPDQNSIVSVDVRTGVEQWTASVPCSGIVPQGDQVTVVTFDPEVDGGHLLAQIDRQTGAVLLLEPIDDGFDDQVEAFEGAVGVLGLTLTGGSQANLVILDAEGREVFRDDDGIDSALGAVDGVAFFGGSFGQLVAYDPQGRQQLWRVDGVAFDNVVLGNRALWQLTVDDVRRLDPTTGNPVWTAEFGVTNSFDVAENNGVAYVLTSLDLVAIDNESGEILWSQPIDR